jgi:predicted phage terminase large subunit-like protein
VWLVIAGRGFGKTRLAAEWVNARALQTPRRMIVAAPTAAAIRDICVEGESGLKSVNPAILYEPSKRRLTWPNGSTAVLVSAEEPETYRGLQSDTIWFDELCASRYGGAAWDQMMFGFRLGDDPRAVVTTTPKPQPVLKELMALPTTRTVRGSTYDNLSNLSPAFRDQIVARYEGTRLGRQELEAEILEDIPGALWQWTMFQAEGFRLESPPPLARIVIAIDPAVTVSEASDETGLVVAGLGQDGRYYVLEDASGKFSPHEWASRAVYLYDQYRANVVVAETNQGGDMVRTTLRTVRSNLPISEVRAKRGKALRAEPVVSLYEQNRVTHVGQFSELEAQLTGWSPELGNSPDRLDALVYALLELSEPVRGFVDFV